MKPQVGDTITVADGRELQTGMVIDMWGLGPILPRWVESRRWFTDLDRQIVGWFCEALGRVGTIHRGTATIASVEYETNTIYLR